MIQKLAKLGAILPDDLVDIDPFGTIKDYQKRPIVFILFKQKGGTWEFAGTDQEEYQPAKAGKYLLIPKPGQQTSEFPAIDVFKTSELIVKGKADFIRSKPGKKLVKILGKFDNTFADIIDLLQNSEALALALAKEIGEIPRCALSIKLDGKYIGQSPFLKSKVDEVRNRTVDPNYYQDGNEAVTAPDKLCVITGERDEVFGFSNFYNFYAPKTEISVVAGGFNKKLAWRNFPTSRAGVEIVERGKWFVENNMQFRFSGLSYFLVPEMVLDLDPDGFFDDIEDISRKYSLSDEDAHQAEIDIVDALAEQHNSATFTMFFFEKNNSEFKILSSIDDIAPSHVSRLREIIKHNEKDSIYHDLHGKQGKFNVEFRSFKALRTFFPNSKIEGDHTARFLEVVRAVLMQRRVSYDFLLRYIMMKLRRVFVEEGYLKMFALQGWLILNVFEQMKIVNPNHVKTETIHMNVAKGKMRDIVNKFFDDRPKFNDLPAAQRAVFLLGVLTDKLLDTQQMERGAQPFRARLNGMHISRKVAERLLPEIIEKFKAYDKYFKSYQDLAAIISELFTHLDDNMSDDERSFYFALGMSLEEHFRVGKEEKAVEEVE